MRHALAAVALALALAVPATAIGQKDSGRVDPAIANGSAAKKLNLAIDSWAAAKVRSYSFQVQTSCFCPPQGFRTIVVADGIPRKPPAELKQVATVPRMFRLVRRAIAGRYAGLKVTYGPGGIPQSIALNPSAQIADEEITYTIRRFKRR